MWMKARHHNTCSDHNLIAHSSILVFQFSFPDPTHFVFMGYCQYVFCNCFSDSVISPSLLISHHPLKPTLSTRSYSICRNLYVTKCSLMKKKKKKKMLFPIHFFFLSQDEDAESNWWTQDGRGQT